MILRERYIKSPVLGAVNWNTISDLRGEIKQISINPSSSSTIYDFRITDDAGTTVYYKPGLQGIFVDDTKLGAFGIYTLGIESASISNASWTTTLIWDENV